MHPVSVASLALAGLLFLALGARLLLLSRRTRGAPEALLGAVWFVGAIKNILDGSRVMMSDPQLIRAVLWIVAVIYPLVVIALFVANWRLFRPGRVWARVLCLGVALIMVSIWVLQVVGVGLDTPLAGTRAPLLEWADNAGMTLGLIWSAYEARRHQIIYTKRWRIGLASRLLGFRYGMWFGAALCLLTFWALIWAQVFVRVPGRLLDVAFPLLSLPSVILMWITFFPPAALRRRLEGKVMPT